MFDAPIDAWYVWVGVALASVVALGITLTLATPPPPSPRRIANVVDAVAASPHAALKRVSPDADAVAIDAWAVGVRSDGGTAFARFAYGPVTPASSGLLRKVLAGRPPSGVFASPAAFAAACRHARNGTGRWRPAPDRLTVRRVAWGEIDATLVG